MIKVVVILFVVLPALYAARVDHRPPVTARAPRGHGAAEARGWPSFTPRPATSGQPHPHSEETTLERIWRHRRYRGGRHRSRLAGPDGDVSRVRGHLVIDPLTDLEKALLALAVFLGLVGLASIIRRR